MVGRQDGPFRGLDFGTVGVDAGPWAVIISISRMCDGVDHGISTLH